MRSYFPDDYMSVSEEDRPPYRWVGIGPRRSGTIMHQELRLQGLRSPYK